jgi:hypothetical protein
LIVDVVDKDLTGVEIRTGRGGSLEGVVIFESSTEKNGFTEAE